MFDTIAVDQLRIGMYIHLEGGWLSHPFPLSSFRLATAEQIETVRGLGLAVVQWQPERSDAQLFAVDGSLLPADEAGESAQEEPPVRADEQGATDGPIDRTSPAAAGADAAAVRAGVTPSLAAVPHAAGEQRGLGEPSPEDVLRIQRAAARRCERQFAVGARQWREARDAATTRPQATREGAEALAGEMLAHMSGGGDIAIQLLGSSVPDRSAAHALNVAVISMLIGRTFGLDTAEMTDLGVGALLHDIGKVDLPDRVHHVDERSTPGEVAAWRDHVARGVQHGQRMALSTGALLVIAQHHELADGSGFPSRLSADRITLPARIVALVNRYDNLCNPALSARAMTPHEAVSLLFAQGRGRWDSAVLNAFIRMMGVYPAGSLVQLTDERWAMVVGVNSTRPLKPRVLVHEPRVPRSEALLLNLEQCPDLGIRRSVAPAKVPPAVLRYLDPRPRLAYYFEPIDRRGLSQEPGETDAASLPAGGSGPIQKVAA
jgi:HD-GYP domain-containing protein (c-di-GMP phosphodiesterase class II)